jgi:4-oxalocrotonate tautomerase
MAIVTVRIVRGCGIETKRKLARALTGAVAEALEVPRASVTVLIEDYERENWAIGGELDSDRGTAKPAAVDLEAFFRKPVEKKAPAKPASEKAAAKASPRKAPAKSRSRR